MPNAAVSSIYNLVSATEVFVYFHKTCAVFLYEDFLGKLEFHETGAAKNIPSVRA